MGHGAETVVDCGNLYRDPLKQFNQISCMHSVRGQAPGAMVWGRFCKCTGLLNENVSQTKQRQSVRTGKEKQQTLQKHGYSSVLVQIGRNLATFVSASEGMEYSNRQGETSGTFIRYDWIRSGSVCVYGCLGSDKQTYERKRGIRRTWKNNNKTKNKYAWNWNQL